MKCRYIKCALLIGIVMILFFYIQKLMIPKWNYPEFADNISYTLDTFYAQEKNVDDVIFLGTSHTTYAVSPMYIYQKMGITSYNLGTSLQSIEGTYYLLKDAFRSQKPKVVVLDVSSLFFKTEKNDIAWRYIIDSMPFSKIKFEMMKNYAELDSKDDSLKRYIESFLSVLFPIIKYHDRWNELTWNDFKDPGEKDDYFSYGYFLNSESNSSGISVEYMNSIAENLSEDNEGWKTEYVDGEKSYSVMEDSLYDPKIPKYNANWCAKIKKLCEDNNAELLLVKYPVIYLPNNYESAWTQIRSDYMKQFAKNNEYIFLDLLYDVDLGIDISADYTDGGSHLNYNGTKKVSEYLTEYLVQHYPLQSKVNTAFESNLKQYNELTEIAEIQLEKDFIAYLKRIYSSKSDYIICMAAKDDMSNGLCEADIKALEEIGIMHDEHTFGFRNSFLTVIDGDTMVYEAASNRKLKYSTKIGEIDIEMVSSGWNTLAQASIKINGIEYAANTGGLNIVIVEKMTGLVIDSVGFNTFSEPPHSCIHKNSLQFLNDFWMASEKAG